MIKIAKQNTENGCTNCSISYKTCIFANKEFFRFSLVSLHVCNLYKSLIAKWPSLIAPIKNEWKSFIGSATGCGNSALFKWLILSAIAHSCFFLKGNFLTFLNISVFIVQFLFWGLISGPLLTQITRETCKNIYVGKKELSSLKRFLHMRRVSTTYLDTKAGE